MSETYYIESEHLKRSVRFDIYAPTLFPDAANTSLLLCNDGQDLVTMNFESIFGGICNSIRPLIVVGIHCGEDRRNEYGMAVSPDYLGRGAKGVEYQQFVLEELLPFIYKHFRVQQFAEQSFAGFSLGGLSALDITWNHPEVFNKVGVFSGSLWWRSKDQDAPDFKEITDQLMHNQVRSGSKREGMKFFFECGELDETMDRNGNGVIDSIDDTLALLRILTQKGYKEGIDFAYLQLADGRHDVPTWGRAFPVFLRWGWTL